MMHRIALLAVVLGSIWAAGTLTEALLVGPAAARQIQMANLRDTLANYDTRLAGLRRELSDLDAGRRNATGDTYAGSEGSAPLWLQGRIRQLIAVAGGAASASQTQTTALLPGHDLVSVTIRAVFSEQGLFHFLADVETGTPFLAIEAMTIEGIARGLDVTATIQMVASHDPQA